MTLGGEYDVAKKANSSVVYFFIESGCHESKTTHWTLY